MDVFSRCFCLQNIRPTNLKDISSVVVHAVNFDRKLSTNEAYIYQIFGVALAFRKCYIKNVKNCSSSGILILQLFKFASHFASTRPLQFF